MDNPEEDGISSDTNPLRNNLAKRIKLRDDTDKRIIIKN